ADEGWVPHKLAAQIEERRATGADVVYSRAWVAEADVEGYVDYHDRWELCPWPTLPTGFIGPELARHNVVPTCTGLVRRPVLDQIGGFSLGIPGAEDWDLWLRLAFAGRRFAAVDDHLGVYAWHPDNFSRTNAFTM